MRALALTLLFCGMLPLGTVRAEERQGMSLTSFERSLAVFGWSLGRITPPAPSDERVHLEVVGERNPVARVDVHVFVSIASARNGLLRIRDRASSSPLLPRGTSSFADTEHGRAGLVVGLRSNVVFEVRAFLPEIDAHRVAAAVLLAIEETPLGVPRAGALIPPSLPRQFPVGASTPIAVDRSLRAVTVHTNDVAYARLTPSGWTITRTAPGDLVIHVAGIDPYCRIVATR